MDGSVWLARGRGFALWRGKPEWIEPMLATDSEPKPLAGEWLWEPRLAGSRCLVWTAGGQARLFGADHRPLDARFAEYAPILGVSVRGDTILDGVATAEALYLFDCLYYEGASLEPLPLLERKAVLRDAVWYSDRVRLTPFGMSGPEALQATQAPGSVAGVVAKRTPSGYAGGRSADWLAFRCARAQEFVIGGYTERRGEPGSMALLIGYYENGRLRYAGRVSTAYDTASLEALLPTLARLRRRTSPFGGAVPATGRIQWTSPAVVAQVGFTSWTPAGLPERPRFIGLRYDREPDEVRRVAAS